MRQLLPHVLLTGLLLVATLLATAGPASAQQDLVAEAEAAFEAENYAEAQRLLQRVTAQDEVPAEAYYLLSRIYYETPLRDIGEANAAIDRARDLDPDNVDYMAAELQLMREESWNFLADLLSGQRRLDLARKILRADSTNSIAHEELGTQYIRDYFVYRNAIALPEVEFRRPDRTDGITVDEGAALENALQASTADPGAEVPFIEIGEADGAGPELFGAGSLALDDRFDIEDLQGQGAAVFDLSGRADRAYDRAIGHFNDALRYDPRRYSVYEQLMSLYALSGDYERALDDLTEMYVQFPNDTQMWLFLGMANHRLQRFAAAARCFDRAFELLSPEERAGFEDLSLILPPSDVADYEADRDAFARRFWTSQNPRLLTPYNERKLEHYSRLVYADLLYRADDVELRGWQTERGKLHVRYGLPQDDVIITGNFIAALRIFGFDGDNLRASEALPMDDQANRFNIWDYGDFRFVFEDPFRNGEFILYSPPADVYADVSAGFVSRLDYVTRTRETIRETPERYTYEAPGRQIELPFLVNSFRGEEGRSEVFLHYGIPLAAAPDPGQDLVDLTIRTGAFLVDDTYDVVHERRRTLYGLKATQVRSFDGVTLWADTQTMEAAPGEHAISIEFETEAGGASAVQRRDITVPDYTGTDLALSDLLLAYRVEETDPGIEARSGEIVRRDLIIDPAPWAVFQNTEPIYLYFEVYNLAQEDGQARYEVEAALAPKDTSRGIARLFKSIFGGSEQGVAVQFPVSINDRDDGQYVILDASEQEAGLYTLALRVRDTVTGETVETDRDLFLE
ncbi:MAG: GWxTD domain-containing protein [Bacteroidota bacterium]